MSVSARCVTCGATWAVNDRGMMTPPPCYGAEGHDHVLRTGTVEVPMIYVPSLKN